MCTFPFEWWALNADLGWQCFHNITFDQSDCRKVLWLLTVQFKKTGLFVKIVCIFVCTKYTHSWRAKAHGILIMSFCLFSCIHILDRILLLTNEIAGKSKRSTMCRSVHVKSWAIMYTCTLTAAAQKLKLCCKIEFLKIPSDMPVFHVGRKKCWAYFFHTRWRRISKITTGAGSISRSLILAWEELIELFIVFYRKNFLENLSMSDGKFFVQISKIARNLHIIISGSNLSIKWLMEMLIIIYVHITLQQRI